MLRRFRVMKRLRGASSAATRNEPLPKTIDIRPTAKMQDDFIQPIPLQYNISVHRALLLTRSANCLELELYSGDLFSGPTVNRQISRSIKRRSRPLTLASTITRNATRTFRSWVSLRTTFGVFTGYYTGFLPVLEYATGRRMGCELSCDGLEMEPRTAFASAIGRNFRLGEQCRARLHYWLGRLLIRTRVRHPWRNLVALAWPRPLPP